MPKDYVIVKGEFGAEMFFIQSGKCDVVVEKIQPALINETIANRAQRMKKRLSVGALFRASNPTNDDDSGYNSGVDSIASNSGISLRKENAGARTIEEAVKELSVGNYFGEIALVTDSKRTASIRSRTFTELLVLSRVAFNEITENNRDDREEMKDHILKRYPDAQRQMNALKEQEEEEEREKFSDNSPKVAGASMRDSGGSMRSQASSSAGERLGGAGGRPTMSKRVSFIALHAQSKGGGHHGGGEHHGHDVENEMHEVRAQMRGLQQMLSIVVRNVEEMNSDMHADRDRMDATKKKMQEKMRKMKGKQESKKMGERTWAGRSQGEAAEPPRSPVPAVAHVGNQRTGDGRL